MDSLVIAPIPQQDLRDRAETDSKVLGDFGDFGLLLMSAIVQMDGRLFNSSEIRFLEGMAGCKKTKVFPTLDVEHDTTANKVSSTELYHVRIHVSSSTLPAMARGNKKYILSKLNDGMSSTCSIIASPSRRKLRATSESALAQLKIFWPATERNPKGSMYPHSMFSAP
ncbi:hypothetical protein B0H19DRAFT_1073073 [Mycena capillaripes]|nr:hypothetical protein B0H19DRAFT_1073073 [Mycena capillaripes]